MRLGEDEEPRVRPLAPPPAQLLVAAVLLLAEDAVEEEVAAEAKAPDRGERGRQHAVPDVPVGQERVRDGTAGDEDGPADVDVARVVDPHLERPEGGHGDGREHRPHEEQTPERADHAASRSGTWTISSLIPSGS